MYVFVSVHVGGCKYVNHVSYVYVVYVSAYEMFVCMLVLVRRQVLKMCTHNQTALGVYILIR